MTVTSEQPTPERLQQVAQQTYEAIKQREGLFARLLNGRNELDRAIFDCEKLVADVDPSAFSEAEFAEVLTALGLVIDALERYFAKHGSEKNVAQCFFLGHSLTSLKESRHWIAQGLSPNPSKRPTVAQRERMATELGAEMFKGLKTA